jgi:hypothetical protein
MLTYLLFGCLRIGTLLTIFNTLLNMIAGATLAQACRAEARKTKFSMRHHWLLLSCYTLVLWPLNLAYTIAVTLNFLPRKSWQELNNE